VNGIKSCVKRDAKRGKNNVKREAWGLEFGVWGLGWF